ncbi:MAG TPA: NADPH-dependent F420 reductase [Thermoanaerobaculia bacterium]|nr:NADPH-dependent F420 reductase [Thermoanaerobaculia bacterium]
MAVERPRIAIIGGTGDLGGGLARRWAKAGYPVIIGSRAKEKAEAARRDILVEAPGAAVEGDENLAAAAAADIVVLTVPYANQRANLEAIRPALQGKILVDTTVPLQPPKVARVQLPPEGSAAVAAQQVVGPAVRVVSAFHNVGAAHLREEHQVECDVLVAGDSVEAREAVLELVAAAGLRGWHAGPLANSVAAESLTSVLIGINRRYGIEGAGIRITGEPGPAGAGK